jgi:hypothetical protein
MALRDEMDKNAVKEGEFGDRVEAMFQGAGASLQGVEVRELADELPGDSEGGYAVCYL